MDKVITIIYVPFLKHAFKTLFMSLLLVGI